MGDQSARRDRRYAFELLVTIISKKGDVNLLTDNVSYRGLFLKTPTPPPKMQLIRLRMTLPTQAAEIVTNAMVAHVAPPQAAVQGAGVCFYGLDGEARAQWERFIQCIRLDHPDENERKAAAAHAAAQAKQSREQLVVAVANLEAFERLISRDVSQGGLAIHTSRALDVGTPVSVRLIHPITQRDFLIDGLVHKKLTRGGLAISLPTMDARTRSSLDAFMRSSDEEDDDSLDIVQFESVIPRAMSSRLPPRAANA